MKRDRSTIRRLERLESRHGGGVETGVRHVEAEEIEAAWAEWEPDSPTLRHGVALVPRELSLDEWEQRYGAVEINADEQNEQEIPTWKA